MSHPATTLPRVSKSQRPVRDDDQSTDSPSLIANDVRPSWSSVAGIVILLGLCVAGPGAVLAVGHFLPEVGVKSYWFISRSSGLVAYLLITAGVLWGLVQSGGLFRRRVTPLLALGMHSFLNWLGLGMAALHGLILIGDGYININLARVLTPFLAEYRPIPVGLGIISFYLMLLLTLSFYARGYLGQRFFRILHYASFGIFLLVTAHGIFAGTDTGTIWWLYAGSLAAVAALTVLRLHSTRQVKRRRAEQPAGAPARML